MNNQHDSYHFFYLAPIRGVTDYLFRNIFHDHFPFFDGAIAPFINPQRHATFKDKYLADILPENNGGMEVTPQLLYNRADDFLHLSKRLQDFGYNTINWNLGCPAPMVANKQRGSGLLPYPERILALLEEVVPALDATISIKTRLGFAGAGELELLLPELDTFKLEEIIIHPRIGKQLYRGRVDQDSFAACRGRTRHRLVYNGDITTVQDFMDLKTRFPDLRRWMIGRGALADPFLLADIRGLLITSEQRRDMLHAFHRDLYEQLKRKLHGPGHLLNRMKQIWHYLIESFPEKRKVLKKIQKASSERKYTEAMEELFH